MNLEQLIQTGIAGVFLTGCVTTATCFISGFIGYKKIKVEHFDKIYKSLIDFTEKRAEVVDKCNALIQKLADPLPDMIQNISEDEWKKMYNNTYQGINVLLTEYSKCLELLLSFSYCLYKNKPIHPIVTAECWSFLDLYEKFVDMGDMDEYRIQYAQIAALVQFIRIKGHWRDRRRLHKYLKRNRLY